MTESVRAQQTESIEILPENDLRHSVKFKKYLPHILVGVVLSIVALFLGFAFFQYFTATPNDAEKVSTFSVSRPKYIADDSPITPFPPDIEEYRVPEFSTAKTLNAETVYEKNEQIIRNYADGHTQVLASAPEEKIIISYIYNPERDFLAYIVGEKLIVANDQYPVLPEKVMLKKGQEEPIVILDSPPETRDNGVTKYSVEIDDLNFNKDATLLAVTMSDGLIIYNTHDNSVRTTIRETQPRTGHIGGVFSYTKPRFSPDNSYVLTDVGVWESNKQVLFNLQAQTIQQTPFKEVWSEIYSAIDWMDDDSLIAIEETGTDMANDVIKIVNAQSFATEKTVVNDNQYFNPRLIGKKLYLFTQVVVESLQKTELIQIDIETGAKKSLLTLERSDYVFRVEGESFDKNALIIRISNQPNSTHSLSVISATQEHQTMKEVFHLY